MHAFQNLALRIFLVLVSANDESGGSPVRVGKRYGAEARELAWPLENWSPRWWKSQIDYAREGRKVSAVHRSVTESWRQL